MEKNHNPLIVVLDTEQYYRLLWSAEIGDREAGGNVTEEVARHARRFNPHLQAEFAAIIAAERRAYAAKRKRMRELFKRVGGEIWHRCGKSYAKAKILGPAKSGDKLHIRVEMPADSYRPRGFMIEPMALRDHVRTIQPIDVWASDLVDALPDGAVYQPSGYFAGTYLLPINPLDSPA